MFKAFIITVTYAQTIKKEGFAELFLKKVNIINCSDFRESTMAKQYWDLREQMMTEEIVTVIAILCVEVSY